MQLLPLGRQTASVSDRMSFRPTRFAVRQYELPGNLLLIFFNLMRPRVRPGGVEGRVGGHSPYADLSAE